VSQRHFVAGSLLVVDSGVLPRAGVGPSLFVAWRPSAFEAELGAFSLVGQHAALAGRGTATLSLVTASARACWAFRFAVTIAPCATFELGSFGANSTGTMTTSASSLWVAPGFALRGRWPNEGRVAGLADAGLAFGLDRPEFVLDNVRHVHQAAAATARAGIGFEVRF
jgi:hypothetical protein